MPPDVSAIRRWEWAALAAILLLAAVVRMGAPGITEFKRDEANLSQRALDLVHGRELPLLGIGSSVSVPNTPISVYLFAIPYAFSDSPILATLFVGLLNVIAVGLAWVLARRYYGPAAALVAGTLYAASPWAAIYSRKIWAQDLLPPFVVAVIFTGLLGFGERRRWAQWAHWLLLAITVQIHYAALVLIPLSLGMLLIERRDVRWRETALVLAVAALTALPALAGAYRDDWLSLNRLRDGLAADTDHRRVISSTALEYAWFTVAGTNIHSLAGPQQFRAYLDSVPDVWPLFKLVPLAAVLSALALAVRRVRRLPAAHLPDEVLAAALVLPVLAFTWEWTEVAPHYLIPLMPAAYVLCGAGAAALLDSLPTVRLRRASAVAGAVLVGAVAVLQVTQVLALLRFLDRHATTGGFGTPLHYLLDARAAVLEQHPRDVIVISEGETAPYDQEPAVWGVLLEAVPQVRFVNGTRTLVIPAGDAIEVIAWSPALITCPALACLDEPGVRRFDLRPGEQPYLMRPAPRDQPVDITPIKPVRFANGAHLIGYSANEETVILAWRLAGPENRDYQAFVHALDAEGQRLDQRDRPAWPGRYWHAGDTLLLWFDLSLPPTTAVLYAGMYALDGTRVDTVEVVDESGAYLAQGAEIALPR